MTKNRYGPSTITIAGIDDAPQYDSVDEAYDALSPEDREEVDQAMYRIAAVLFGPKRDHDDTADTNDSAGVS